MVNERSKESKKARLYPNAMTEGLDFANEISLLSSSIPDPVSAPAQAPVPIPAHVTAPGQVYSMQTKNDAATLQAAHGGLRQDRGSGPENNANGGGRDGGIGRVTDLTSKPGTGGSGRGDQTSKRPFTSGRDLFVQDGGKLPEASKKRERGIDGATEFVGKRTLEVVVVVVVMGRGVRHRAKTVARTMTMNCPRNWKDWTRTSFRR